MEKQPTRYWHLYPSELEASVSTSPVPRWMDAPVECGGVRVRDNDLSIYCEKK